jgi:dTDP-N-acetylfucosamine:lipid II N-acetylfucosaminyltransferase
MNYHLMIDDKFIDDFIEEYEDKQTMNNIFIIEGSAESSIYAKHPSISFVDSLDVYLSELAAVVTNNDSIFIHWLHSRLYEFILSLPSAVKVGMFFWGGEVVETPKELFAKENYEPDTLAFYYKYCTSRPALFRTSVNPLNHYKNRRRTREFEQSYLPQLKKKNSVLQRMDYFFHWNVLDYQWISKRVKGFNPVFLHHCYGLGLHNELPLSDPHQKKSTLTFWIGNSATLSNNHFDALHHLKKYSEEDIRILCPLSYGEGLDSDYTKAVIKTGTDLFGDKFVALTGFLPRVAYYKLLAEVDIAVMWHNRTQAAGNVVAFLKMGKIVFMQSQSTLYKLLKSRSIHVCQNALFRKLDFQGLKALVEDYRFTELNSNAADSIFQNKEQKAVLYNFLNSRKIISS